LLKTCREVEQKGGNKIFYPFQGNLKLSNKYDRIMTIA